MKKTSLSLIALFAALQFSYAQWTASGANIHNLNTGDVGIGTTTPSAYNHGGTNKALEVHNSGTSTNSQSHVILSTDATTNAGSIGSVTWGAPSTSHWQKMAAYVGSNLESSASSAISSNLVFATNSSGALAEKMRITSTGNIGIGVTNPGFPLEVKGSANFFPSTNYSSASSARQITVGEASDNPAYRLALGYYQDPTTNVYTGVVQSTHGGAGNNLLLNPTGGNVAIGTTNPQGYKLAVNGAAIATSMKVKPNGAWPDFVFLKEYKLPTLTEVKTYIDKNQHLPDMPSADEVHKNGLDLGEMNRLLLKKVEELTLYLIEQKEESEKQKEEYRGQISQLKEQLDVMKKSINQK